MFHVSGTKFVPLSYTELTWGKWILRLGVGWWGGVDSVTPQCLYRSSTE